ncbi:hypothetical protein NEPAR06_1370 [Nematocida parisii]|nr:hypothetical protein NEPAR03_0637 [Nematocida parisii]KAI5126886.1 hypothetical protein NEPAR08_0636 [Nematocida parisii]KAI5140996.1 hypothetical protein NEPAR04_0634 [Nematocida parisii]KAI5143337.1 hypothetical protein NEPAR07_0557 [Nematocida parisii]KAI5154904.1 hypothetical protein NEPAR06_1370 [Nematocida parisii]
MQFVRRSQEKKRERESMLLNNVSTSLKKSIGYSILLNMGWNTNEGLGKNKDGRTTIDGLVQQKKRIKRACPYQMDYRASEEEYNRLLKEKAACNRE